MMKLVKKTPLSTFIGAFALMAFAVLPARAVDIQTITSPKGVTALLVEDYTVPIIAMQFAFKGGSTQDVQGKEGTARLLTTLLDEGAGDIESQAFQEKLDEVGVTYSFNASLDSFSGGIRTLRTSFVEGSQLLSLMINKPRFDADPIERMKTSALTNLKRQANNPRTLASRAVRESAFRNHPYSRPTTGTIETVSPIVADDLRAYVNNVFARDNIVIGVVGAISAEELKPILDNVFATLPEKANLKAVPEAKVTAGETVHVDLNIPQTNIGFIMPGLKRDDPDFFAAYLVNHILGGGSFSSRLYDEVREKRGLAYGVYSYLGTFEHAGTVGAGSATNAKAAQKTIDIMRAEMKRMGEKGPTVEEFEKAKKFITGAYAISNLDSSSKIASVLVAIQQGDLGIDYIDKRKDYLEAVTLEQARKVAKRLFMQEPTLVTVGQKLTN